MLSGALMQVTTCIACGPKFVSLDRFTLPARHSLALLRKAAYYVTRTRAAGVGRATRKRRPYPIRRLPHDPRDDTQ